MTSGTAARDQGPGTGAAPHSAGTLVLSQATIRWQVMAHYRNVIRAARDSGVARSVAGSGLDADPPRRSATRSATGTPSSRSPRAGARLDRQGIDLQRVLPRICWPAPAPAASFGYPPPMAGYRWSPALTSNYAWRRSWRGRGRCRTSRCTSTWWACRGRMS